MAAFVRVLPFNFGCACRIFPTALPTIATDAPVVSKSGAWELKISASGLWSFGVTFSTLQQIARTSQSIAAVGNWTHVCGAFDAKALMLDVYVNARLDNGALNAGALPSVATPLNAAPNVAVFIGRRDDQQRNFLAGKIDNMRLYDSPVSQSDVDRDASTPVGESLVAAYSFDNVVAGTVRDSSKYGVSSRAIGCTSVTGKYGGALSFDKDDVSFVDLQMPRTCFNDIAHSHTNSSSPVIAQLELFGSQTYTAWVQPAQVTDDDGTILARERGTSFKISPDSGQVRQNDERETVCRVST